VKRVASALAVVAAIGAGVALAVADRPADARVQTSTRVLGRSVQGRPIKATRVGSARARTKILVVGAIHGNERAGIPVVRRLRRLRPPRGTALWLIDSVNPDGVAKSTRQNARGVDLNRNFPYRFQRAGKAFDTYYSGAAPLSEPESRAVSGFVRKVRPRVTVYFHQHKRVVDPSGGDRQLQRVYSRRSGLPLRDTFGPLRGTATGWQNHTFRSDTAFVVELPGGSLSRAGVRRHAGAVTAVARAVAPPRERSKPIPFGARRKAETRAYAKRHYGIDDYRLRRPRVIVEHYTDGDTFASAFNTFAADRPDAELGELPGTCSHFVVDRDGAIYRLVPTSIICRHTVGLNYTAIGIEHVGRSDGQVLGDRRQREASLRLTRALQGRFHIATKNVIGHNESLSSPYHRERVARLRKQTHGDFRRRSMNRYRRALGRLPAPRSLR
jgi:N-acetylmuramoyl-L-alanine amidase